MVTKEIIQAVSELILPDINRIRADNIDIKATLGQMDKRLGAIDTHLADQSRRIDTTNQRIDEVRTELGQRIDAINQRIDRLAEVIVRREEFSETVMKVLTLEREINELKRTIAA